MEKLGNLAGVLGILVAILAAAGRLFGNPAVFNQRASSVLLLGTTLLVLGCFLKTLKK